MVTIIDDIEVRECEARTSHEVEDQSIYLAKRSDLRPIRRLSGLSEAIRALKNIYEKALGERVQVGLENFVIAVFMCERQDTLESPIGEEVYALSRTEPLGYLL